MAKISESMRLYVGDRWPRWLRRSLEDADVLPAQLARAMLGDDPDRNREPRAAISGWLRRENPRIPTATMAFTAGQAFAVATLGERKLYEPRPAGEPNLPSFAGRPPIIGGLVSLHGAGYFGDTIDLTHALLRSNNAEARRYAARFVAVAWIAHADLDGIDRTTRTAHRRTFTMHRSKFTPRRRKFMRQFIGDAPIEALEVAWKQRHKVGSFGRALTAYSDLLDADFDDATHLGAVTAWRSLTGIVALLALKDDVLAVQWRYAQLGFEDYWREVMRRHDAR